jgi:leucyl-tRNA synthetase
VWVLAQEYMGSDLAGPEVSVHLESTRHKTIKKVTDDYRQLGFNTAIAALMEYVNELYKAKTDGYSKAWQIQLETLTQLLAPFAPHICAELWQLLGHDEALDTAQWPAWDEAMTTDDMLTIVVQINGKVRAKLQLPSDISEQRAIDAALNDSTVQRNLDGRQAKKTVYVPGRLVSIVV